MTLCGSGDLAEPIGPTMNELELRLARFERACRAYYDNYDGTRIGQVGAMNAFVNVMMTDAPEFRGDK